ncbi:E3 ubiquitin-protein ligase SH3RF1 isoform X4 [Simochromis diagramma]|uniref:E3 ubiquitin-protein ligase SH3RF1 isoform X4 n=1 Tax=Simochromis diagramma TaxID=43689 RepID=UPI001A7E7050|nr:E3 ubiquitin-protein ligase SH3RF1 isoform X4 [Simochromis diagramma]
MDCPSDWQEANVMVDYSVSDVPEALFSNNSFKMEELALMALLECPLCLEKLDASAKVLPCQHTFCLPCLQRHEADQYQLFCPECRAPVPARTAEELPTNLLLVRLLEGLNGPSGPSKNTQKSRYAVPVSRESLTARDDKQYQESPNREKQGNNEGDILTFIRRADENWIEAKLGEKVGFCPEQFTEPNSVAAKLLKGKSRRGGDLAEFHHQTSSGGKDKATDASSRTAHYGVPQAPAKTPVISTLPLSNQRKQPVAGGSNFYQTEDNNNTFNSYNRQGQTQRLSVPTTTRGHSHSSRVNSQRRRHSDSHRHLLQSEKKMTSETPPTISMALMNPQMPSASADGKNSSTQQLSISVCAVLYSYKPRRPEELELRKGEMVGVYGTFKEGWLRGLSLRTGKVGILPGNYVTPVLRTSARLLETKAPNVPSQYSTLSAKKHTAAKNPTVFLALDKVNGDGAIYSPGQIPSVPNGAHHAMSPTGIGKPSFYGDSQGWETVRRIFHPHRGSNRTSHMGSSHVPSNSQHFAQHQASGYSPALQRKKGSSFVSNANVPLGWMTDPAAPSSAVFMKDRDSTTPQSILVKPDMHKTSTEKPAKSVRFVTNEGSPPPRHRTASWSSGNQVLSNSRPGPLPLEVWAPSLTLGRDGPGIILKDGKGPILRKGLETAMTDFYTNQKPTTSQPTLSAVSAQFSPSRHRVAATHLAQTDSELSLLQGELVLVHRPRLDGRVLVTQESSGQTGFFQSSILQSLERLS